MLKLLNRERRLSTAVLVAVSAILVLLAMYQYIWSEQAMKASTSRMASLLRASMLDWHGGLFHQFADICFALRVNDDPHAADERGQYARRFQLWQSTAEYPHLVANLSIWELADPAHPRLLRLNPATWEFEPTNWSSKLQPLRAVLESRSENFDLASAASSEPESLFGPAGSQSFKVRNQGPGDLFSGWLFEAGIPALVHPIPRAKSEGPGRASHEPLQADWIVIEFDPNVLWTELVPQLTQRYFSGQHGLDYEVAVITSNGEERALYATSPRIDLSDTSHADAAMDVLGSRHHREITVTWPDRDFAAEASDDEPHGGVARGGPAPLWFPLIVDAGVEPDWDLIVWHRNGSLAAQARRLRWRNLGVSFGALLLVAFSTAMLAFSTRRAQQLADKEINFVAAVSHELRTPLAVISSAADNLADGVVRNEDQLLQYGTTIQNQARQLSDLVEQILLFAATRKGTSDIYALGTLQVSTVIEVALQNTEGLIHQERFRVERDLAPDLPPVIGDRTAVSQVLQNLITNAVKYGGPKKWIGIRGVVAEESNGKEVEISVSDRGIGIRPDELARIFEPFYRSAEVTAAQIHGTGLGLPLAKSIAEAMGGRLTVRSEPAKGSTFTLALRVAQNSVEPANTVLANQA